MIDSNGVEKELVWVEKDFAEKYKLLDQDAQKTAERISLFEEYMQGIKEASKAEFKSQLESLEEDAAIYKGLMLQVRQTFEKAKNEQLSASYALWNKFEDEIPNVRDKIAKINAELQPLQSRLEHINGLLAKIQTYNVDRLLETLEKLNSISGTTREMVDFLAKNFTKN